MPPLFDYWRALAAGWLRRDRPARAAWPAVRTLPGISVVIPSRNGRDLLAAQLPALARDLEWASGEIIVADNGSDDGTEEWLRAEWPRVRIDLIPAPLSFARAVNRGSKLARYSHLCLLNNDMLLEPGFFASLRAGFDSVPDLFCATAQIRFPEGVRREETGKAVMAQRAPEDFPLRCEDPLPGEDGTPVLYGSGGCSLYDAAKWRALGGADEIYEPAYVEDLDLGYRAWQRGWPSVYAAGALVEHRHRATTRRYYSEEQLEAMLERNYLHFVAGAPASPQVFRALWKQALGRLLLLRDRPAARKALHAAPAIARLGCREIDPAWDEASFLALTNGSAACFPGGGARAAVSTAAPFEIPSAEMLARYAEVTLVAAPAESLAFRAALEFTRRKWGDGLDVVT